MRRLRYILLLLVSVPFLFSFLKKEEVVFTERITAIIQTPPDTISWRLLGRVKILKKSDPDYGEVITGVMINRELKLLNNKRVVISGFIVPEDNVHYALSKNTFAACYFCGKAGPETVMGIQFREEGVRFKNDTYLSLEGKLKVNGTDPTDYLYAIEDAVVIERPY